MSADLVIIQVSGWQKKITNIDMISTWNHSEVKLAAPDPAKEVFICPKERNHKCEGKDRFVRHLWNCKMLKSYPEFYSCKYETLHLFVTQEDKMLHERECPAQVKYRGPNATRDESTLVPNLKFKNPGYDPTFVGKKVDTTYYTINKERLIRQEQEIKNEKARVRINVTNLSSVSKRVEEIESSNSEKVVFFGTLDSGFAKYIIRIFDKGKFDDCNPEFSRQTLLRVSEFPDPEFAEFVKSETFPLEKIIGEIFVGNVSRSFAENANKFKSRITEEGKIYAVKDKKENIFGLVPMSAIKNREMLFKLDAQLISQSILVVHYMRSKFYDNLMTMAANEKKWEDEIAKKTTEISQLYQRKKEIEDEKRLHEVTLRGLQESLEASQAEIIKINNRMIKDEGETATQAGYLKFQQEVIEMKQKIRERQENLTQELELIKKTKITEYVESLYKELEKINSRTAHYKHNIENLRVNLQRLDEYNYSAQDQIKTQRSEIEECNTQIEDLRRHLEKEKDTQPPKADKKQGIIMRKEMNCHLCKSGYVAMVTKPCNHCVLCWSCYQSSIQAGLRNCLMCNQRVEFVFKIKYS